MEDPAEDHITAAWKDYIFHVATPDDCSNIVHHLGEHFITNEPINRYIGGGVWNSDRAADTFERINYLLADRLSFYLTTKDSSEIIAVNLISDSRKPPPFAGTQPRSPVTRMLRTLLTKVKQNVEVQFQSKFKCEYYAEIFMTSVNPEYCGQGIATEMYRRSLKFLKAKGYPVVRADLTHPGTQRIGQKLGFLVLSKFYLKDQMDEKGGKLFPDAKEDEFTADVAKRL